jgi:hypothetical protein
MASATLPPSTLHTFAAQIDLLPPFRDHLPH